MSASILTLQRLLAHVRRLESTGRLAEADARVVLLIEAAQIGLAEARSSKRPKSAKDPAPDLCAAVVKGAAGMWAAALGADSDAAREAEVAP